MCDRSSRLLSEVGEDGFAEELGLAGAVVAPDFQHDVSAAGCAIFFDALNAFFGCTGYGADLAKDFVGDGFGGIDGSGTV